MMEDLDLRQKRIAANLLAGLTISEIAEALGASLEDILDDVAVVMERWQGQGPAGQDGKIDLARLNRAIHAIWGRVVEGDIDAIEALIKIIERRQKIPADDDEMFPAPALVPGQVESREAYRRLEEIAGKVPWWDDYLALRQERGENNKRPRWDWRKAVYIAWASMPKRRRWPATQEELATKVLGLTNDRTIREWKAKDPSIDDRVAQVTSGLLMRYRANVFDALASVAQQPDPKAHADRKLFLEMTGDYKPRGALALTGEDGGPVQVSVPELEGMSEAELDQIIANLLVVMEMAPGSLSGPGGPGEEGTGP